jgi:hypothetical protein
MELPLYSINETISEGCSVCNPIAAVWVSRAALFQPCATEFGSKFGNSTPWVFLLGIMRAPTSR